MSVDRYIYVMYPLRYESIVTQTRVVSILAFSWIYTFLTMVLCIWVSELSLTPIALIPLLLISNTWIHLKIVLAARHQQKAIQNTTGHLHPGQSNVAGTSQRAKTALSVTYLFALFFICYTPIVACFVSWNIVGLTEPVAVALAISVTVVYINSSLNPGFYCWCMPQVWRAVRKVVKNNTATD